MEQPEHFAGLPGSSNTSVVDGDVDYLVLEERVQLGNAFENRHDSDMNAWMHWSSLLYGTRLEETYKSG